MPSGILLHGQFLQSDCIFPPLAVVSWQSSFSHSFGGVNERVFRAGAQWRTHASSDEKELCEWDTETYKVWMDMANEEKKMGKSETGLGVGSSEYTLCTAATIHQFNSVASQFPMPDH